MKQQPLFTNDDAKWESNRKKYWESLYCSQFVIGNTHEAALKISKIRQLFLQVDGMKNYDADETNKLLSNRDLRRRSYKDFDAVENKDKSKFCPFTLSKEFVEKRQKEFTIADTKSLATESQFSFCIQN